MHHCPYCGSVIKENELFCTQCGEKLPSDLDDRLTERKNHNPLWYIPITLFILMLISIGGYYLYLQNQTETAKTLFNQGEQQALDGNFDEAQALFERAIQRKSAFPAAITNKAFSQTALEIKSDLIEAENNLEKKEYQQALTLIDTAENKLKNYTGEAVNKLIEEIVMQRQNTQLQQLKDSLTDDLAIDEIKNLLWQAESIQTEAADTIATNLREQIIAYTFSTASDYLNNNQFSDARDIVSDGLKYVPESNKLLSLKTTIEKEKTAFETEQQERIEQAMNAAEEERQINQNDAVELIDIKVTTDEQENLVVTGKIKSVATVPINSVSIQYNLLNEDESELLTNEIYVYPDTIYPDEEGKFDFTHYDIGKDTKEIKVKIKTIKWFID